MAKKKNKDKKKGVASMDISTEQDVHQAMDTTEVAVTAADSVNGGLRKIKKGVQMKRSKNVRKMKAIKKAISKSEKSEEKINKIGKKVSRTQSAKLLYD